MKNIIESASDRGLVSFELARSLFRLGIPQRSVEWYSEYIGIGNIQLHNSFGSLERFYETIRNGDVRSMFEVMNIYSAFSLSELHQMLMPVWGMLSLPVPLHHTNEWRWVSVQYQIEEQTEAEATGKYLIGLIEHEVILPEHLYVNAESNH